MASKKALLANHSHSIRRAWDAANALDLSVGRGAWAVPWGS